MGTPNLIGHRKNEKTEGWYLVFSPSVKEAMSGAQGCRVNSLSEQNFIGESPNELWKMLKAENDPRGIECFTAGPTLTLMALAMGIQNSSDDRGDISNLESFLPQDNGEGANFVMLKKEGKKWKLYVDDNDITKILQDESLTQESDKCKTSLWFISDELFYRLTQVKEGLDVKKAISTVTMNLFIRAWSKHSTKESTWEDFLKFINPAITD